MNCFKNAIYKVVMKTADLLELEKVTKYGKNFHLREEKDKEGVLQSSLLSSFTCILVSSNLRACIRTLREQMALMGERERLEGCGESAG